MITPYSSFANRNKALRQEYPVPISAQANIVRENLEYYNGNMSYFGPTDDDLWSGDTGSSSSSSSGGFDWMSALNIVTKVATAAAPLIAATKKTKTPSQQLNTPTGGNSGGYIPQGPQEKPFIDGKTLAIGGGVFFLIVVILILKLRR